MWYAALIWLSGLLRSSLLTQEISPCERSLMAPKKLTFPKAQAEAPAAKKARLEKEAEDAKVQAAADQVRKDMSNMVTQLKKAPVPISTSHIAVVCVMLLGLD